MKKLIVFSVVFALLASAVFAEINVGGNVFVNVVPFKGSNAKDSKVTTEGGFTRVRLEADGQDENGTFGGYIRIDRNPWWGGIGLYNTGGTGVADDMAASDDNNVYATGNAWWQPIDQFKILIGGNGKDGFFGADGFMRWGFYQNGADGVHVMNEGFAFSPSFYGGFDEAFGVVLTVKPIDALEINLGLPLGHAGWENAETKDVYPYTHIQVSYSVDGIGRFALTYAGAKNELGGTAAAPEVDAAKFWLYGDITAIENVNLNVGVGFTLPVSEDFGTAKVTVNTPVAVGLGANISITDEFALKARAQATLAGSVKTEAGGTTVEAKSGTNIIVDVLPSYKINDSVTALLDAGLVIGIPDKGDSTTGWHVEPVIAVKGGWWSPSFWAGFRLESDGKPAGGGDTVTRWSVPIGISVGF